VLVGRPCGCRLLDFREPIPAQPEAALRHLAPSGAGQFRLDDPAQCQLVLELLLEVPLGDFLPLQVLGLQPLQRQLAFRGSVSAGESEAH
jgi:hypothetical protein